MQLREFLAKIAETAERRDCLLSEFKNDFAEVIPQIQQECAHWNGVVDDNGQLLLGRLFHKMLDWKHYNYRSGEEYRQVPFHCYMITEDDVLFTRDTLHWDESAQQYAGVKAEMYRNMSRQLMGHTPAPSQPETSGIASTPNQNGGCMGIILALLTLTTTLIIAFL